MLLHASALSVPASYLYRISLQRYQGRDDVEAPRLHPERFICSLSACVSKAHVSGPRRAPSTELGAAQKDTRGSASGLVLAVTSTPPCGQHSAWIPLRAAGLWLYSWQVLTPVSQGICLVLSCCLSEGLPPWDGMFLHCSSVARKECLVFSIQSCSFH